LWFPRAYYYRKHPPPVGLLYLQLSKTNWVRKHPQGCFFIPTVLLDGICQKTAIRFIVQRQKTPTSRVFVFAVCMGGIV